MKTTISTEQHALLTALIPLATAQEAEGLRQYRAGGIRPEDLPRALTKAVTAIVGYKGRLPRRPVGAPKATDEQRGEIVRLAAAAGVVLA